MEEKSTEVGISLHKAYTADVLLEVGPWPLVKSAYIALIDLRFDDELAEISSCELFNHGQISDGCMFINTTRQALRVNERVPQTWVYQPCGDLDQNLRRLSLRSSR